MRCTSPCKRVSSRRLTGTDKTVTGPLSPRPDWAVTGQPRSHRLRARSGSLVTMVTPIIPGVNFSPATSVLPVQTSRASGSAGGQRRLSWPGVRDRMDRACGLARGLRYRRDRYPGRDLRRGPAAALPGQRARHAQPGRHAHEPALQRYCHPWGSIPVPAAAPGRRPPGPAAHRRDPARRHRRIGHPRRTNPRPEDLRSGRIRRPASAWAVAHRH